MSEEVTPATDARRPRVNDVMAAANMGAGR
jgi:hypothetical protein